MAKRAVDNLTLARWQGMESILVLRKLAVHLKIDNTYSPVSNPSTVRLFVNVAGHDWELLCMGPKFWDVHGNCGGGGAVDLVMHLFRISFKSAVALLLANGI